MGLDNPPELRGESELKPGYKKGGGLLFHCRNYNREMVLQYCNFNPFGAFQRNRMGKNRCLQMVKRQGPGLNQPPILNETLTAASSEIRRSLGGVSRSGELKFNPLLCFDSLMIVMFYFFHFRDKVSNLYRFLLAFRPVRTM